MEEVQGKVVAGRTASLGLVGTGLGEGAAEEVDDVAIVVLARDERVKQPLCAPLPS